jgi:hypothetical protein
MATCPPNSEGIFAVMLIQHRKGDRCQTGEPERSRHCWGHIDHAAAHKWPAVINSHHYRLAIAAIGDAHLGSKRQRAMRRSESVRVSVLSARGSTRFIGIDRSDAGLCSCVVGADS